MPQQTTKNRRSIMQCFKCEKSLDEALYGTTLQPSDGTDWSATGNYGSTVFDPCGENACLVAHICDECLSANAHLVHLIVNGKRVSRKAAIVHLRR